MTSKRNKETKKTNYVDYQQSFLDINKIKTENSLLRYDNNISQLAASIKLTGLIQPLIIDSKNKLLCGGRRLAALKSLGYSNVPVMISNQDDVSNEILSLEENLEREDFNGWQKDFALKKLYELYIQKYPETICRNEIGGPGRGKKTKDKLSSMDTPEAFVDEFAKKYGCSSKTIQRSISRARDSAPAVINAWKEGKLKSSQVSLLAKLDSESQEKLLPEVIGKDFVISETIIQAAKVCVDDALALAKSSGMEPKFQKIIDVFIQLNRIIKELTVSSQNSVIDIRNRDQLENQFNQLSSLIEILLLRECNLKKTEDKNKRGIK